MSQTQSGLDGEINALLVSGSDITAAQLRQVLHDMNTGIFQSGITGFATPAVNVGLTSDPGSALTALRSDARLALGQDIAPTWTNAHIFANGTPSVSPVTGAVTVAGGVGISGMLNTGTTINSAGSIYINNAPVQAAQRVTGTVSGTVGTSDYSITLPTGATVLGITMYTTGSFGASGTVTVSCGSAVGDVLYMAATSVKVLGVIVGVLPVTGSAAVNLASMPFTVPGNFYLRIGQGGTPSAIGRVVIVVDYLVP